MQVRDAPCGAVPAFFEVITESVGRGRFHACPSWADPTKGGYETRAVQGIVLRFWYVCAFSDSIYETNVTQIGHTLFLLQRSK